MVSGSGHAAWSDHLAQCFHADCQDNALHESRDVALPMYIIFLANSLVWLGYGASINNLPILVTYSVGTVSALSVIIVYFAYRKQGRLGKAKKFKTGK